MHNSHIVDSRLSYQASNEKYIALQYIYTCDDEQQPLPHDATAADFGQEEDRQSSRVPRPEEELVCWLYW